MAFFGTRHLTPSGRRQVAMEETDEGRSAGQGGGNKAFTPLLLTRPYTAKMAQAVMFAAAAGMRHDITHTIPSMKCAGWGLLKASHLTPREWRKAAEEESQQRKKRLRLTRKQPPPLQPPSEEVSPRGKGKRRTSGKVPAPL